MGIRSWWVTVGAAMVCGALSGCSCSESSSSDSSDEVAGAGPDSGTHDASRSDAAGRSDAGADASTDGSSDAQANADAHQGGDAAESADSGPAGDGAVDVDANSAADASTSADAATDGASPDADTVPPQGNDAALPDAATDSAAGSDGAVDAGTDADSGEPSDAADAGEQADATGDAADAGDESDAGDEPDSGDEPDAGTDASTACDRPCDGACESCTVPGHEGVCTVLEEGTVCRDAAGDCDAVEECDGTDGQCPADLRVPAATECRGSGGVCDTAEVCDGQSMACPEDGFAPAATVCATSSESSCAAGDGCAAAVRTRTVAQYCSGLGAQCDGELVPDPWLQAESCGPDERCVVTGEGASAQASCQTDSTCLDQCVAYVAGANGSDAWSGWSWTDAKATIQAAIDAVVAGCEVWIRQGAYTTVVNGHVANVPSGVSLYGGFVGAETLREERSTDSSLTVLDGVSTGVVIVSTGDVVVDGLTVTGGVRGMSHTSGNLTVSNCTLENNGKSSGAGLYISEADSFVVVDSVFRNNTTPDGAAGGKYGGDGGGMYVDLSPGSIERSWFEGNKTGKGGAGSGTYWGGNGGFGAGLFLYGSTVVVKSSVFKNNECGDGGAKGTAEHGGNGGFGGGIQGSGSSSGHRLTVTNCTFWGNSAGSGEFPGEGAAIHHYSDYSSTITNSILWSNPGTDFVRVGTTAVTYSDIEGGNYVGEGIIDQDPLLDANLVPQTGSPCIDAANDTVAPIADFFGHGRYDDPAVDHCDSEDDESCGWFADMGAFEYIYGLDQPCGGCLILSVCYAAGDTNPGNVCEVCDPQSSSSTWTMNDGATCDDGVFCNGTDKCEQGACKAHGDPACPDDGVFCNGVESCNEQTETCSSSGDPCQAGVCDEGAGACDCEPRWPGDDCTRCLLFVDGVDGWDSYSGRSWDQAYETMYAALWTASTSAPAAGCEIWVRATTYTATAARRSVLRGNMALYGGFAGTETFRDERDWVANKTALSGGNTVSVLSCAAGNGCGSSTVIDGFTIRNGRATAGAGLVITGASPTIANCTFSNNTATGNGGGIFNDGGSPTITGCVFSGNTAQNGGGIYNEGGSALITRTTFSGNTASSSGGGLYSLYSSAVITNSDFAGNSTTNSTGGGMQNNRSDLTLTNCTFSNNTGTVRGGGVYNYYCAPRITNCTFLGNSVSDPLPGGAGTGMFNAGASPIVTNCILWGKNAVWGPPMDNDGYADSPAEPVVTYSDLQEGYPGEGNINVDPLFVTGSLRLAEGSECVDQGNAALLPPDTADLDGDGDVTEPLPFDMDGTARVKGTGVDMGAYEQ